MGERVRNNLSSCGSRGGSWLNFRELRLLPPPRGGRALGLCPPSATPPLLSPTSATARRRAATPPAISWSTTTSYNTRLSCVQVISYQLLGISSTIQSKLTTANC